MITMILASCVIVAVVAKEDPNRWERSPLRVFLGIGGLIAAGVFLNAASGLGTVEPAGTAGAFRTGSLVPSLDSERPFRVPITYVQRSWWGLCVDGRWTARPKRSDSWEYLDNAKGWKPVPWKVYESQEEGGDWEVDNRGYHEVR